MATRSKESKRALDEASRYRRNKKSLDALEQDNFHEEPHANLVMSKRAPKFEESLDDKIHIKKRKSRSAEYYKLKYRKNLNVLIEEQNEMDLRNKVSTATYSSIVSRRSQCPSISLCSVCGFPSAYTCYLCGMKFCCIKCKGTHQDTRCLKWTS